MTTVDLIYRMYSPDFIISNMTEKYFPRCYEHIALHGSKWEIGYLDWELYCYLCP